MLSGSVRQRLDPLDSQCSNAHMLTVADKGSFDWRVVGRRLLPDSYQIIEDIELEYKTEQNKRDKMFKKWKEMKGSGATYRSLMAVFNGLDNQEAAEMVKNLVAEAQQDQQVAVNIQTVSDLNEAQQDQQAAADVQAVRNSQSPPTFSVNEKHFIKDNCGCGRCNFEGLVTNGCPNPLRQQFLYLNTTTLTKNEKDILLLKLKADADAIDEKHHHIALKFEEWMKENVTVEQYRQILLKLQGSMRKDVPMLKDRWNEIRRADHADCSAILSYYYTWFNCSVLKQVLEDAKTLTHKDPKEILSSLQSYTEEVLKYCKRNIFECPPPSSVSPTKGTTYFLLKLKTHQIINEKSFTAEEIRLFEATLMTSLNIPKYVLTLCTVTDGCVELVYSVPLCIYSILFPLNEEQRRHLITLGVTEIKTKDYHYKNEHEMVTAPRSGVELEEEEPGNPRTMIHVQGKNQPPLPLASKGYIHSSHVKSSATYTTTLILLISSLAILGVIISYYAYQWNTADAQNFSCNASFSESLHPGTIASCNCTITSVGSYTRWIFTDQANCTSTAPYNGSNFIWLFSIGDPSNGTCGPYLSAACTNVTSCKTSILTITVDTSLDGLGIACLDIKGKATIGQVTMRVTAAGSVVTSSAEPTQPSVVASSAEPTRPSASTLPDVGSASTDAITSIVVCTAVIALVVAAGVVAIIVRKCHAKKRKLKVTTGLPGLSSSELKPITDQPLTVVVHHDGADDDDSDADDDDNQPLAQVDNYNNPKSKISTIHKRRTDKAK